MKTLGYCGGPFVVDFMAAGAEGTGRLDDFAVVGPAAPQTRHARLRRLAVAALTVELDAASARRLDPLIRAMEEVDEQFADARSRPIAASFAAMVEGLVLPPGGPGHGDNLVGGGVYGPAGAGPERASGHEGRVDLGAATPLRRVGT